MSLGLILFFRAKLALGGLLVLFIFYLHMLRLAFLGFILIMLRQNQLQIFFAVQINFRLSNPSCMNYKYIIKKGQIHSDSRI